MCTYGIGTGACQVVTLFELSKTYLFNMAAGENYTGSSKYKPVIKLVAFLTQLQTLYVLSLLALRAFSTSPLNCLMILNRETVEDP